MRVKPGMEDRRDPTDDGEALPTKVLGASGDAESCAGRDAVGLILCGDVVRRTRRCVGERSQIVIGYAVLAGDTVYNVEDWNDPEGTFAIGQHIRVRVYVRAYVSRGGGAQWGLSIPGTRDGEF